MAQNLTRPATFFSRHNRLPGSLISVTLWLFLLLLGTTASADTEHKIYFQKTDYELHVYEIRGEFPGNTLLIIGGMHNEPGGYLSADLYADFSLHQGNLIVVPRANFPVIISNNRKIHSDMNRKFKNGNNKKQNIAEAAEYEEAVVETLMQLMARSDILLNLHDGSGFYRPKYINKMKNPYRWGQCIISDTDTYTTTDGRVLHLKDRVQRVLDMINPKIKNDDHKFHYNNTRTFDEDSPHKEQRGSATYYALTEHGIETYGVETSKSIDSLDLKVRYQSMVINAFMKEFEIIPSSPKVSIQDPALEYLLVSVNGGFPYGIPNNKTLYVNPGDRIRIEHIAANYERGLVADIKGLGSLNDMNKEFELNKPHSVLVKKDQFECGKIYIAMNAKAKQPVKITARREPEERLRPTDKIESFLVVINDEKKNVLNGETVVLERTDALVIQDIEPAAGDYKNVKVNFVGFVGNKNYNDAEDRGYRISPGVLWKRHSLNKKGELYRVDATLNDNVIGEFFVRISNPVSP